jgi:hypothetical protein
MKDNFFIILVVGIVLAGSAVFLFMRFFSDETPLVQSEKTGVETEKIVSPPDNKPLTPDVRYTGKEFIPARVTLSQHADVTECFLTVINESTEELIIRLGPHNPDGEDPGFPYSPIPPGESLVIDPRYRIEKISLHNHLDPEPEIIVELDQSCLL